MHPTSTWGEHSAGLTPHGYSRVVVCLRPLTESKLWNRKEISKGPSLGTWNHRMMDSELSDPRGYLAVCVSWLGNIYTVKLPWTIAEEAAHPCPPQLIFHSESLKLNQRSERAPWYPLTIALTLPRILLRQLTESFQHVLGAVLLCVHKWGKA